MDTDIEKIDYPDVEDLVVDDRVGYPRPPKHLNVLSNGAAKSTASGRFVYPPGTFAENPYKMTTERARELHRQRVQKKEDRIREKILERLGGSTGSEDFVDEFANAAGLLWEEIVLGRSPEEHPGRTRMDVWKEIGKQAGIVPDPDREGLDRSGASITLEGLTPELAREVRKIIEASRK